MAGVARSQLRRAEMDELRDRELYSKLDAEKRQQLPLAMPTELERENLHNLDVGDDYHLQGDAKWETERKRVERERLQASAKIRSAAMQFWTTLGLHADEATEPIVDAALCARKPFAVVPCCVFANTREGRARRVRPAGAGAGDGEPLVPVRTHAQFVRYLRAKSARIKLAKLDFAGRNDVLYCTGYS